MKDFVTTSVNLGTHFVSTMPYINQRILHIAITKSIDENVKVEIGLTQNSPQDDIRTLELIKKKYGHIVKTSQERICLPTALMETTKKDQESIMKYHQRFNFHVAKCRANKMFPFIEKKDLYRLYLHNMQEPALRSALVSIETNNANSTEWISLKTLADMRDKAETIITADHAIDTTGDGSRCSGQNTPGNATEYEQMVRKRSLELKRALYNTNANKCANVLRHLQAKFLNGCYLHKTRSHKFLNCSKVKLIYE